MCFKQLHGLGKQEMNKFKISTEGDIFVRLMDSALLEYIGKSLYQTQFLKELKRYVVFRTRCATHSKQLNKLDKFFSASDFRKELLRGTPSFVEQATRSFFYKDSTWNERVNLVMTHIELMEELFQEELLRRLYVGGEMHTLWEDTYLDKPLKLQLWFYAGQRKEGCLSMGLIYENIVLYQIMFWLAKDKNEKPTIYVGALQGAQNGAEIIKGLTKAFFGYRTKNLIFYGLRSFAKEIGAEKIYAVGNSGYYAMNHIRRDRKLKTDFGAFWEECEGEQCKDKRFYVMPVAEYRKAMEELKPSKRAQHRRRFAKMDELEAAVKESLAQYKK